MQHFRRVSLIIAIIAAFTVAAFAEELPVSTANFSNDSAAADSNRKTYTTANEGNTVNVNNEAGVDAIYVEFDRLPPGKWTVTDVEKGTTVDCGLNGFLHDFADLKELFGYSPKNIDIHFTDGSVIADVHAYSGDIPDSVQRWEPYLDKADLVLLTTHSDDEQLFFAGLLPYYAIERKLDVQVVYFIQHFQIGSKLDHVRPHEQLDGLWTVGIRHYPYISEFPDVYAEDKDRQTALNLMLYRFKGYGYTYDDFLGYTVGIIRRFKPLVLVTHDLNGEYGHGAHVLNADTCVNALGVSGDPSQFTESAERYGVWVPQKMYVHLYDQNQIEMDWDTPYDSMGGYTPFQMTQQGWMHHVSQHYAWFYRWILGTKYAPISAATQIKTYSPCKYGLYHSLVGEDISKNDMFEHIITYAQRSAIMSSTIENIGSTTTQVANQLQDKIVKDAVLKEEPLLKNLLAALVQNEEHKANTIRISICAGSAVLLAVIIFVLRRSRKKQ